MAAKKVTALQSKPITLVDRFDASNVVKQSRDKELQAITDAINGLVRLCHNKTEVLKVLVTPLAGFLHVNQMAADPIASVIKGTMAAYALADEKAATA